MFTKHGASGYLTYRISRPEAMDVFLHQDVRSITSLGMLTNHYRGKILMLPAADVEKSSLVREFMVGKEKQTVGSYLVVVL